MARLKLQSAWDDESRLVIPGPDKAFLGDLVRDAQRARQHVEDMDLLSAFEAAGGTPSLGSTRPPSGRSSVQDHGAKSSGTPSTRGSPLSARLIRRHHVHDRTAATVEKTGPGRGTLRTSANGVILVPRPEPESSGKIERCTSPCVARIPEPGHRLRDANPDVPAWFRHDGCPATVRKNLLPEFSLWVTLHGGDGSWKRRDAKELWHSQVKDHQAAQREWHLRAEKERARALEAERRRRQEAEEEERAACEAEALRQQKREEAERRAREAELARRKREEEEERQRQLRLPRECKECGGSGLCKGCQGRGFVGTLYLSAAVNRHKNETDAVFGQLARGCDTCGGWGDDAAWGEFVSGSGRCAICLGVGSLKAPEGGWKS